MAICISLIFCGAKSVGAGMRSLYSGDRVLDRGVNTQQLQSAGFEEDKLEKELANVLQTQLETQL